MIPNLRENKEVGIHNEFAVWGLWPENRNKEVRITTYNKGRSEE